MSLVIRDVSKVFDGLQVLQGVNLKFGDKGIYCLMGPSGTGKTTFLRILMGLERADTGEIKGVEGKRFSAVFQEDEECVSRPVYTLSGGMKRRTAVCRALLAAYDILVMDEPFAGLDEETRGKVIGYVREKTEGKLVILSTHMEEDAAALGGMVVRL